VSGIETIQIIQYAGRVVQLAEELFAEPLEPLFIAKLEAVESNAPEYGDGAKIYRKYVKPSMIDLEKLGAHYSISSLFAPYGERTDLFSYAVKTLDYHKAEAGKMRMALGKARFTSKVTQESEVLTFWVVHFGDHNVTGGVAKVNDFSGYDEVLEAINESFARVDIPEVVRLLDKRFQGKTYSLRSLFRDEQRRILGSILSTTVSEAEAAYLQIYEHHAALIRFVNSLGTPMPRELTPAMEYAINCLLRQAFSADHLDQGRILGLIREARASQINLDTTTLEFALRRKLESLADKFAANPSNVQDLDQLSAALTIVKNLPFPVVLWVPQNLVYAMQNGAYARARRKALRGDLSAKQWVDGYLKLSELLSIRVPGIAV
jgi:hypothetical protein